MSILKILILISLFFFLGYKFGRWDEVHGAEYGEKLGEKHRKFIEKWIIK